MMLARRPTLDACLRLALPLVLALAGGPSLAQGAPAPNAPAAVRVPSPPSASASFQARPGGPSWAELTADQRLSLAPLAGSWAQISEAQKRKWIALAGNFGRLSPQEQAKLHSRMTEWAALSPQQRAQARLNFGETQQLSAEEKRAKWEAYQALSPEEKRKLAESADRKPPTTAAAVKPVAPQKLATLPKATTEDAKPPRIVAAPPAEAVEPTN